MKSKKTETYLNRIYKGDSDIKAYNRDMVEKAICIAEEEIKEKAKNTFKDVTSGYISSGGDIFKKFIEILNEE